MDLSHRLAFSYYKTIATINEAHGVYLVQHQSTHQIFVKKILNVYNIDIYTHLYRHPISGTPKIIDYYEKDNKLFLIEEYISGTPLSEKISSGNIKEQDIISYALDLCNILENLHSLQPAVIHRDIKPSNIIITSYNRAILLDFNAAKEFSSNEKEDTVLIGTKGYAAPEQYGFGSSSPQTDIYSLGIVIEEMLAASNNRPSKKLSELACKCSMLDPKERYSSITDLKSALLSMTKQSAECLSHDLGDFKKYLLPGFRTGTPWHILVACITYLFIFYLCLSLEVANTYGPALWLERIVCLTIMLSIVFGCFNYMNIQKLIPLCQSKNKIIHYLGIGILIFSISLVLMILLFIIETCIFHVT